MMNLLSGGVMLGLLSSYNSSGMQGVAMKEYNAAKSRGDEAAMESSMGYATTYGGKAMEAVDDIQEALAENVEIAEAEKKAVEEAATSKSRQAKKADAIVSNQTNTRIDFGQVSSERQPQPAAVLDLSDEYIEWKSAHEELSIMPIVDGNASGFASIEVIPAQPLAQEPVEKGTQIFAKVNQSITIKQLK